jgi:hypothetical protein
MKLLISKAMLICLGVGAALIFSSLYQIEVIEWQKYHQYPTFAWPFGFRSEFWLARDIFYTWIAAGWALTLGSVLSINPKKEASG